MTDIPAPDFRALSILDPDRQRYHADVRSFQAHRVQHVQIRLRIWFWVAVTSWLMVGLMAAAITTMLPLKTTVPLWLVVHDDGTVDSSVSLSDLGGNMAEKVIRASVWRYIQERESYSFSDARRRYDLVSLMSGENVQHDYQQWFLHAPDSPQKTLGKKGQMSAQEISMSPVRDGVFIVRFWRTRQLDGEKPEKTSATATVEYELLTNAPATLTLDDPAAIRIVRYQIEENSP